MPWRLLPLAIAFVLLGACGVSTAAPPPTTPPPSGEDEVIAETVKVSSASSSAAADHLLQLLTAPRPRAVTTTTLAPGAPPPPPPLPPPPPYKSGPRPDSPVIQPPPPLPAGDGTVYAVGDSVLLGASDYLHETLGGWDLRLDGKVGRRLPEGIDIVRENQKSLGQAVVIVLGHNDGGGSHIYGQLDELMSLLRNVERVVMVTVTEWTPGQAQINRAIRVLPKTYPNVVVAEWAGVVAANPDFLVDNVHPNRAGKIALANLIAIMLGPAHPNGRSVAPPKILAIPPPDPTEKPPSTSTTTTSSASTTSTSSTTTTTTTTTTIVPASSTTTTIGASTTTTESPTTTSLATSTTSTQGPPKTTTTTTAPGPP